MSTIVLRSVKGTPLTNTEVDTNFSNLNTDKLEASTTATLTNKTINLTSNTLVATSAQLAAAVTDETGSGALVFATSPTLVTPALGTPSSGVVTNLTGTASININGTVGATTANTGAFTTLTTSSTVTHNGGTANGVAYLNGSKVLTTGSALTFDGTNLAVGSASAIGSGRIGAIADLTAANGLVLRDSATTYANNDNYVLLQNSATAVVGGLTHPASQSLGVWGFDDIRFIQGSAASEQMRLASTGLTVQQGAVFNESGADSDFRVESDTNTHALFVDAGANSVAIGTDANFGSSSRLSVQTDGTNGAVAFARNTDNAFAVATDYYKSRGSPSSPTAVQNGDGLYQLRSVPYQGSAYAYLNSMVIEVDGTYTSGQNPPTRMLFFTNTANGSSTQRLGIKSTELVVNDPGGDYDFRVESDANTHMLFVDAGNNIVKIGDSATTTGTSFTANTGRIDAPSGSASLNLGNRNNNTNLTNGSILATVSFFGYFAGAYAGGSDVGSIQGVYTGDGTTRTGELRFRTINAGTEKIKLTLGATEAVFNDESVDYDFRVESDTNTHALFVDAGTSTVGVNNSTPASGLSGYDGAIAFGGYGKVLGASNASVAASGYIDLTVNSGGGSFNGFLTVANVYTLNANERTQVTYSIFGRGTNSFSAQLIATDNGSTGGMAITISNPADGVIRITNSAAVTSAITAAFFGATGF